MPNPFSILLRLVYFAIVIDFANAAADTAESSGASQMSSWTARQHEVNHDARPAHDALLADPHSNISNATEWWEARHRHLSHIAMPNENACMTGE